MSYNKLNEKFNLYLNQYIQINGTQTTEQIRTHARNYAIQERGGRYDLTAKKYYCSLFTRYLLINHIQFPEGWSNDQYDPDNELTEDINVQRLRKEYEKRVYIKGLELINNLENNI